jgi:hypothetical protein
VDTSLALLDDGTKLPQSQGDIALVRSGGHLKTRTAGLLVELLNNFFSPNNVKSQRGEVRVRVAGRSNIIEAGKVKKVAISEK